MNRLNVMPIAKTKFLLFAIAITIASQLAHADAFRCANGTYTSNPEAHQDCSAVSSSIICAKSSGNKFVAPGKSGIAPRVERCVPSEKSQSPFVNLASAQLEAKSPFRARAEKPLVSSESKNPADLAKSTELTEDGDALQNIGPADAGKILECAANSMFGGGNAANCLSGK